MEHYNQGKDYAGFGTFVLPDPVPAPEYIKGQDLDAPYTSLDTLRRLKQRPKPVVPKKRPCGFELSEKSKSMANVMSHQKGLQSTKEGPHTYIGFTKECSKDVLSDWRFEKKAEPKQVSYEDFNETSLRWKYGNQEKNKDLQKGVNAQVQMSRDIIYGYRRGANESGFYAGNRRVEK